MQPDASIAIMIPKFLKGMVLGAACGYGGGRLMVYVLNRISLDVAGLYPVLLNLAHVLHLFVYRCHWW
jgi:cell volume regulation protein A